jgi:hypothetical protein
MYPCAFELQLEVKGNDQPRAGIRRQIDRWDYRAEKEGNLSQY